MNHQVLVVDDDTDIRETLVEVLEEQGFEAIGAGNGQDALSKLRALEGPPCLILLDLMMPIMDGKAFREEQLKDPMIADIPVVVISAFRDVQTTADEMKATAHIRKPISLKDLMELVHQYC